MLNKGYYVLGLTVIFFSFSIGFSAFLVFTWDEPIDESESSVQINLPVIDWDRYLNLSKQP